MQWLSEPIGIGQQPIRLSWQCEGGKRQSASYLRRRFTLDSVKDARLYITAHGIYTAKLNGRRVGELLLTPGSSNYEKRLEVQTYDVTELLCEGENELLVTIGDGWYRGGNGNNGETNVYGTHCACHIFQHATDGFFHLLR